MQAIILAGGRGTRLKDKLGNLPKPLISICGTPLLERQITLLKSYGFTNIILLVNYASDKIIQFCNKKNNWNLNISFITDGQPLGTAGAVLRIYDKLHSEFLVVYGDTMLDVDLLRFQKFHQQDRSCAMSIFLHPNDHPADSDLVEIDEKGEVIGFYPYPHEQSKYYPNLVNAALYWINKESLYKWKDNRGFLDFGKGLFPMMLKDSLTIRGYNSIEYIKDCGTPERFDKICSDLLNGKISKSSLNHTQKAVFLDRDGTINYEVDLLSSLDKFELLPKVAPAIKAFNHSEYLTCIITNQSVIARGECSFTDIRNIHNKMETLLGREGAFINKIYLCPHHPDKGFVGEREELKIDCNCRKPNTGMVDIAIQDLNIQPEKSWLIGDTSTDMLTAKRAGLKSVLVETGYAGLDQKYWASPDYTVPNLLSASKFILEIYPRLYSYCERLTPNFEEGSIIVIGGLSRSGKTTFSNVLRDVLLDQNKNVQVISLDRWLKSEEDRQGDVLDRYDIEAINKLIRKIEDHSCRPLELDLPGYNKKTKTHTPSVEKVEIQENQIVIIEGTIGLHFQRELKASHRFFVHLDENLRKNRVINEYLIRNFSLMDARNLYEERQYDETPIIKNVKNFITINMNLFFTNNKD